LAISTEEVGVGVGVGDVAFNEVTKAEAGIVTEKRTARETI